MKKLTDLIATLIAIGFCAFLVVGIGVCASDVGLNPNFVLLLVGIFSIPTIISLAWFIFCAVVKPKIKKKITVEQILYRQNVYPLYLETSNYFRIALQNKILTRAEILEFKSMLDQALQRNLKHYKSFKFKNDAHEIYTKLKSHHISTKDMEALKDYIMPYAVSISVSSISNPITEQPYKQYEHLRVVK